MTLISFEPKPLLTDQAAPTATVTSHAIGLHCLWMVEWVLRAFPSLLVPGRQKYLQKRSQKDD